MADQENCAPNVQSLQGSVNAKAASVEDRLNAWAKQRTLEDEEQPALTGMEDDVDPFAEPAGV
jgi:hypothetical protein